MKFRIRWYLIHVYSTDNTFILLLLSSWIMHGYYDIIMYGYLMIFVIFIICLV